MVIVTDGQVACFASDSKDDLRHFNACILKNAKSIIRDLVSLSVFVVMELVGDAPPAAWKSVSDLAIIALKRAGLCIANGTKYLLWSAAWASFQYILAKCVVETAGLSANCSKSLARDVMSSVGKVFLTRSEEEVCLLVQGS